MEDYDLGGFLQRTLTPAERQRAEIEGARNRARNWQGCFDTLDELETELREQYANNLEACMAAVDEVGLMRQEEAERATTEQS